MAEIILNVEIAGTDGIDADIKAFQAELSAAVQKSMDDVGAEMQFALKKHIETDVYEAYTPKEYERRSENGARGTPLNDIDANTAIYNKGAGVTIDYLPTGEHSNAAWHTADGSELIGRIENKNPPYFAKAQEKVPPRPFWQNFVNEMVDQGELERFFVAAMQMHDASLDIMADGSLTREGNDGAY